MNSKLYICLLVFLLISWIVAIRCILKFRHVKEKMRDMEEILSDVQKGNENRRILVGTNDVMAPLIYRINEIVYAYEEKLLEQKKSDETSKQLMTSLAHDVRTPLTTLIGYLDAVHKGIVTGKEREEYIETARRRAYDLKDYIDVLFDWFRLNSSEYELLMCPVEITEFTRNILKDWIPIFREKSMEFEIDIPDKCLMVNIDIEGYSRVVNNLVQNVIAHSEATLIKISMVEDGEKVVLRVEDNGIGISKQDLQNIFERLYKCDKGRSKKGSGLGLSIVRQMVERMGGSITAESEMSSYTAFLISLPLK